MKDRPLIMYPHEVRAARDGRQTQFRRVMNPQPTMRDHIQEVPGFTPTHDMRVHFGKGSISEFDFIKIEKGTYKYEKYDKVYDLCPYGVPGDRLWVRETWAFGDKRWDGVAPSKLSRIEGSATGGVYYLAEQSEYFDNPKQLFKKNNPKWRPSIHMPRWASRLILEVVNVWPERLQEISKQDAMAEGMVIKPLTHVEPRFQFERLWDSINGKKYPWAANPWVWATEFKLIENRG